MNSTQFFARSGMVLASIAALYSAHNIFFWRADWIDVLVFVACFIFVVFPPDSAL